MEHFFQHFWPHITTAAVLIVELLAAGHAVLYKRDTRATIGWVGLILLTPLLGAVLYWTFGINRIHRRARLRRSGETGAEPAAKEHAAPPELVEKTLGRKGEHFERLVELVGNATERPLLVGNKIEPLVGGDEAYPAMLQAIDGAQRSISLASYIFDNDRVGKLFSHALSQAQQRGVEIRVLIDYIGARYTFPTIVHALREAKVRTETFMRSLVPGYFAYFNLRSHRKIMVVDGTLGFTGGMNIREGCWLSEHPKQPTKDLHFRVQGPVVTQLQEVFSEDWVFSTGEVLKGELWYPPQAAAGETLARGIAFGPDESKGIIGLTLIGAVGVAQRKVSIVTPYFLPDEAIVSALNVAAMRGVEVNIVLPQKGNLITVQWAMQATLWQVLQHGCKVWLTPPPFDHTKLMVVDGIWTLLGSSNWDPRSLRLNFEFDVECYDRELAGQIDGLVAKLMSAARSITLADVDARKLPARLRDGIARLASPYL
ncbi:MAG TPA: phospholipase D-like domain-containing protein [Pirellulales bacterium]|nr:phospholipase D-like domain-containing protein [Pirellulales bacterium]